MRLLIGAPSQLALDDARFDEPAVAPRVEGEVDAHRMPSARHAADRTNDEKHATQTYICTSDLQR